MGSVRLNTQRETWFIDYIDATGQRIRELPITIDKLLD